jgi:YggT family protein
MLVDIAQFLLKVLGSLLVGLLILRVWIHAIGMPGRNPVVQFVVALTSWLVRPLHRLLPARGRIDWASVAAAFLVTLLVVVLIRQIVGADVAFEFVLLATLRLLIEWALNVVIWITIIYAIVSWVNPHAPFAPALGMLLRPLLAPIQRMLPPVSGFDLSPLVLVLAAIVLQMVVTRI